MKAKHICENHCKNNTQIAGCDQHTIEIEQTKSFLEVDLCLVRIVIKIQMVYMCLFNFEQSRKITNDQVKDKHKKVDFRNRRFAARP